MKSSLECTHPECTDTERCVFAVREYVAQLLRSMRRDAKLSQRDLAERMGTQQSVIARMESGTSNLRMESMQRYANACGFALTPNFLPFPKERDAPSAKKAAQ